MSKKIRILQINAYYQRGSTGNIVKDIELEGKRYNFEMYTIYWLEKNKSDAENVYYCGRNENISNLRKFYTWIFKGGKISYNTDLTTKIVKKIKEIDPDIIHLHNLHGDFEYGTLDLQVLFASLADIQKKVIWTFHDCWPITGRCYYFSYKNCNKWKNGCGTCPQRFFDRQGIFYDHSNINWEIKKLLYEKIKDLTIITVSDWLNEVVKESMLKERNIFTIYNGIDLNTFKPLNIENQSKKFRILCIGWDRRKGYKDYYRLSSLLRDDEEILVVGKRPIFRRFRKLPKNIIEIERASSIEQMAKIYNSADIYFNPSLAETFGLTTVEAMSCGLPVVGYNNTATREIISIADGGMIVPNGNINIAYKCIYNIRDLNMYDKNILYKTCSEIFSKEKMVEQYMNIYTCKFI